jgi:hypothetical protein
MTVGTLGMTISDPALAAHGSTWAVKLDQSSRKRATMTKCKHCGKEIQFDAFIRKWVSGKKPPTIYTKAKKGTWKCDHDPEFPIRAHSPE